MIYSRSAGYAIRAFVYLADVQPRVSMRWRNRWQEDSDIPSHFLAKILKQLARQGFLRSSKGPTGGLYGTPPRRSPAPIVEAIDGLADYQRCIGGT